MPPRRAFNGQLSSQPAAASSSSSSSSSASPLPRHQASAALTSTSTSASSLQLQPDSRAFSMKSGAASPQSATGSATPSSVGGDVAAASGDDVDDEEDVCFICAEPVKFYSLGVCGHVCPLG